MASMARFKVGVQLRPQHTDIAPYREAWEAADEIGVDTIYNWDHFYPLYGEPEGKHYECWTLLAAMAVTTRRAQFGALVTCNSYRNPHLLADMARTVDHLSGGRLILGIGSGWFEKDYTEYGYEFGTAPERLRALRDSIPVIKDRLRKLNPPAPDIPLLIGGGGEKVTLRIVAEQADMWNSFGPPENFAHKNAVLDEWCAKVGRDPKAVIRTVMISAEEVDDFQPYLDAGADHIIVGMGTPFDMKPVERLLAHAAD
jgi:probable F420-dependent oxidoreductase